MTATDVIAVVAILVSVITAWTSWVSAQKTAERQQTFELRFYRLSMLDPAKGALRRILIDSNRRTNVAVHVQGGFSAQDFEALKLLDREAVNTFHAISHHLPPDRREVLGAKRTALEGKWMQRLEDRQFHAMFAQDMKAYVEAILQAVEDRLQALLDNA